MDRSSLELLLAQGLSVEKIARRFGKDPSRRYGLRTRNSVGRRKAEVARSAKAAGMLTITRVCARHGETDFILEGRGYYRCKRCRAEGVARHRRRLKAILVQEAGGQCIVCGYNRHPRALEFHHLDPSDKRLALSANGVTISLEALREEARKCVLLCSNCHAEVEDGIITLPIELRAGPG
jgi:hypothetical protein